MTETQTANPSSFFKDIGKATPTRGLYVEPGHYEVTVDHCKAVQGYDQAFYFIVELLINSSNNPVRPAGSSMSWVCSVTKHKSAMSNVRDFIATCTGAEFNDIQEKHAINAVSSKQPLAGTKLLLTAVQIDTRKGGKFTQCKWSLIKIAS